MGRSVVGEESSDPGPGYFGEESRVSVVVVG